MKPRGPWRLPHRDQAAVEAGGGQIDAWAPEPATDENPLAEQTRTALWPVDPLGDRRSAVRAGASRSSSRAAPGVTAGRCAKCSGLTHARRWCPAFS